MRCQWYWLMTHARFAHRVKGDKLNLSHSRSVAVDKRKKTLLEEYRRVGAHIVSDACNSFVHLDRQCFSFFHLVVLCLRATPATRLLCRRSQPCPT